MAKRLTLMTALVLGGLTLVAASGAVAPAQARVWVGIGVAPWGYPGYYPDPYYYGYPPPVVYAPPPAYYAPAPAPMPQATGPAPQAAANWYYCANPQGYYPYVPTCSVAWRQVAATPQQ